MRCAWLAVAAVVAWDGMDALSVRVAWRRAGNRWPDPRLTVTPTAAVGRLGGMHNWLLSSIVTYAAWERATFVRMLPIRDTEVGSGPRRPGSAARGPQAQESGLSTGLGGRQRLHGGPRRALVGSRAVRKTPVTKAPRRARQVVGRMKRQRIGDDEDADGNDAEDVAATADETHQATTRGDDDDEGEEDAVEAEDRDHARMAALLEMLTPEQLSR